MPRIITFASEQSAAMGQQLNCRSLFLLCLVAFTAAIPLAPAAAAMFTVTSTAGDGPGSLSQAIEDANAAPGADEIVFAVPGTGPFTIRPTSMLPWITSTITIDGTTQPGYAGRPLIELDGSQAGATTAGITVTGSGSTVRGLVINNFSYDGIIIAGRLATDNVIQANYVGTDLTGRTPKGNGWDPAGQQMGIRVGFEASRNLVVGNVVSGNVDVDISVANSAFDNIVRGNLIGTDSTGMTAVPSQKPTIYGWAGLEIQGGAHHNLAQDNVISGGNGQGLVLYNTFSNRVVGNVIGVDATRTGPLPNLWNGIVISDDLEVTRDNIIGGLDMGAGNLIASNKRCGITVEASIRSSKGCINNAFLGNSIFANGELGINLNGGAERDNSRVTGNDVMDSDSGPNNLQNYPEIAAVVSSGDSTLVRGTLGSAPDREYIVEFFANDRVNPSGYGEGQRFLGRTRVKTDGAGIAVFAETLPVGLPSKTYLTATATDPDGNTSEFSAAVASVKE